MVTNPADWKNARPDKHLWRTQLLALYDAHQAALAAGQTPDRLTVSMLAARFGKTPGTVRLLLHRSRPALVSPPAAAPEST